MFKYTSLLVILTLTTLISGCGTTTGAGIAVSAIETIGQVLTAAEVQTQVEDLQLTAPRVAVPGDVVETTPSGEIDWSGNTVRAILRAPSAPSKSEPSPVPV